MWCARNGLYRPGVARRAGAGRPDPRRGDRNLPRDGRGAHRRRGRDPWLRENPPKLEWFGGQFAPAEVLPEAPICEAVKRAHEQATGEEPIVEGVPYGADMRLFIRFGGCRVSCTVPGTSTSRTPRTNTSITELLTASKPSRACWQRVRRGRMIRRLRLRESQLSCSPERYIASSSSCSASCFASATWRRTCSGVRRTDMA